jgi:ribonuclease-3
MTASSPASNKILAETLAPLQARLGHDFADLDLLAMALRTPGSTNKKLSSYERLEFLGDRVLGLFVAQELYRRYPHERQGDLSKRLVAMVRQETLVELADTLDLIRYVRQLGGLSAKEVTPSIISDVVEALIAAIFVDAGFDRAMQVLQHLWQGFLDRDLRPPLDGKTELQEWSQARNLGLPEYSVLETKGSAHQPIFRVQVKLPNWPPQIGEGKSKRAAEQAAAAALLREVGGGHG